MISLFFTLFPSHTRIHTYTMTTVSAPHSPMTESSCTVRNPHGQKRRLDDQDEPKAKRIALSTRSATTTHEQRLISRPCCHNHGSAHRLLVLQQELRLCLCIVADLRGKQNRIWRRYEAIEDRSRARFLVMVEGFSRRGITPADGSEEARADPELYSLSRCRDLYHEQFWVLESQLCHFRAKREALQQAILAAQPTPNSRVQSTVVTRSLKK